MTRGINYLGILVTSICVNTEAEHPMFASHDGKWRGCKTSLFDPPNWSIGDLQNDRDTWKGTGSKFLLWCCWQRRGEWDSHAVGGDRVTNSHRGAVDGNLDGGWGTRFPRGGREPNPHCGAGNGGPYFHRGFGMETSVSNIRWSDPTAGMGMKRSGPFVSLLLAQNRPACRRGAVPKN